MSEPMMWLLVRGVWETLAMTFVSGFFGFVIGLPVGVLLYVTRPGQIIENAKLYRTLSAVVNIFRSIPFIILLVSVCRLPLFRSPSARHRLSPVWWKTPCWKSRPA